MRLVSKNVTYACPPHASSAYEYTYYGSRRGRDKVRLRFLDVSDDIFDAGSLAFSPDNGASWPESRPHLGARKTTEGTLRRFEGLGFVDPENGLLLTLHLEGLFRKDNSLEGMSQYYLNYRVSADGGKTALLDERVIQKGPYTPEHPCEHVWIGRNAMSIPNNPPIVRTREGHLVASIMISTLGPDGNYHNPGGGFTWLEELILFGRWREDAGTSGKIEWELGPRIALPPEKSTRGLDEATLATMPDGRLLLVIRGSNGGSKDPEFRIPGRKWACVSSDSGRSWSEPAPWGYAEGSLFHSPASMSQILRHSNGTYYWIGNISPENPRGNGPRFPLVMLALDPASLRPIRESTFVVDTRGPDDPEVLHLSNFAAHEDRADGTILLEMPRLYRKKDGKYTGDTYRYRIEA